MITSEVLNIILGGGLVATIVGVITLKSAVRKANAEAARAQADAKRAEADAEKARADAETVHITNTENATRILVENIVKPLKDELNATREDLQANKREMASAKREMARLRKAVEAASACPHSDGCPVLYKLRVNPEIDFGAVTDDSGDRNSRHHSNSDKADTMGDNSGEQGGDSRIRGQPP